MRPDICIFSPLARGGTRVHGGITAVVSRLGRGFLDLGCSVELVTFSPGDPRALAHAIETLRHDPALAKAYGESARRRIAEHFPIDETIRSTAKLYGELAQEADFGRDSRSNRG